jgi:uncharacterized RDD family membrane protein YckC
LGGARPRPGVLAAASEAAPAGPTVGVTAGPTAGPAAGPTDAETPPGLIPTFAEPAGFVSRSAALILDAVLVTGAAAAGGYLISALLQALRPGILGQYQSVLPTGLFVVLFLLYFVFSWATLGRTVGMAFVGLKVLTLDGRRVSFPRAVLRYVGYLLSTAFVFLGFLWVLIDDRRLGWLDHIARTKVVRTALPAREKS